MNDNLDNYNYDLPKELISQKPKEMRDHSRLMVLPRESDEIIHARFFNLPEYLNPGDVLVLNNTRVLAARLYGRRKTGGHVEVLLLRENTPGVWDAFVGSNARLEVGEYIYFEKDGKETGRLKIVDSVDYKRVVRFDSPEEAHRIMGDIGIMPLPHYIKRSIHGGEEETDEGLDDETRYQTVYAAHPGAVAAPTAGLHFTDTLLEKIRARGVKVCFITLHVGEGTFSPIRAETVSEHKMASEWYEATREMLGTIAEAHREGRRIIGVGTTVTRVLETLARQGAEGKIEPIETDTTSGWTSIFIHPPQKMLSISGLITNFHLPKSTPLMLACAFAGRERVLRAYEEAKNERYRFYSYGDSMLII